MKKYKRLYEGSLKVGSKIKLKREINPEGASPYDDATILKKGDIGEIKFIDKTRKHGDIYKVYFASQDSSYYLFDSDMV